jgi:hypothetical protein
MSTPLAQNVTDTFTHALSGIGTLTGTFTLTNSLGAVLGSVTGLPATPLWSRLTDFNGTCEALHLELGPLDLDLLGLWVHLNRTGGALGHPTRRH